MKPARSRGIKSFFGYFFFKKSNFFLPLSDAAGQGQRPPKILAIASQTKEFA
jgi:hypothetical protein